MKILLVCVAMVTVAVVTCLDGYKWDIKEADDIIQYLNTKKDILHFITESKKIRKHPTVLKSFTFKDCGGTGAMVNINSLSVSPDPLAFPGPLNIAADFKINSALDQPLKGDLYIAKKVLGKYIKLPCVDNFGSCSYPDLCQLLEQVQCPDPIVKIGIDCKCPLKANSYTLPKTEFDVDASVIPAGDYQVRGNATYMGKDGACIELTLSFE